MSPRQSHPSSLARIRRIHARLREGRALHLRDLADELEVHPRTLKRDIELMRSEWNAPIVWEPTQKTYFYDRPFEELPLLRVTADEAVALRLASTTFAAWRGSALGLALREVLEKLGTVLGSSVSVPLDDLEDCITDPAARGPEVSREQTHIPDLVRAIQEHRVTQIDYAKPGLDSDDRLIHPLHLAYLEGRWVCIAHDPARQDLRHFLLVRMETVQVLRQTFTPPADFDAPRHLAGAFGRFVGDQPIEVTLRFAPAAGPYLRERRWHASQELQPLPGGACEMRLRLTSFVDLRRWVLSWGRLVEVIEPTSLRQEVAEELRQSAARYSREGL